MEKQSLWQSYIAGITDRSTGERYITILTFFLPELITAFLSMSLLNLIDSYFISCLASTSLYATQGVSIKIVNILLKIAEGISIGTVVLVGNYNGAQKSHDVGRAAITSLWFTACIGFCLSSILFFGGHHILLFLNIPEAMVDLGVPFLRIRAIGIFFAFMYFALIGFLRGIKKPGLSMKFFIFGGIVFIVFDYILMFGKFGFPEMQLQGSAIASVIQYASMLCAIIIYVVVDPKCRHYSFHAFKSFDRQMLPDIVRLSWPVIIDKTSLTFAKLWLVRLIAPMGKMVIAGFTVISDMEQFAFVPALALAQVITFLVSNDYGIKNWDAIKNNTKKVMFLASVMVLSVVVFFSLFPTIIIGLFDKKNLFTTFAAVAFPLLSTLVIFDVFQIILSGALRGASNVKTVMITRVSVTLLVFVPLSYMASISPIANPVIKFVLIFGSYYISNGVMSVIFVYRFRREAWKQHEVGSLVTSKRDLVQPALPTQTEDTYEKNSINIPGDQLPGKDVPHQDQLR